MDELIALYRCGQPVFNDCVLLEMETQKNKRNHSINNEKGLDNE